MSIRCRLGIHRMFKRAPPSGVLTLVCERCGETKSYPAPKRTIVGYQPVGAPASSPPREEAMTAPISRPEPEADPRQKLIDSIRSALCEYGKETGHRAPLQFEIAWVSTGPIVGQPECYPGLITLRLEPQEYQG